jgi:hypothetical protein
LIGSQREPRIFKCSTAANRRSSSRRRIEARLRAWSCEGRSGKLRRGKTVFSATGAARRTTCRGVQEDESGLTRVLETKIAEIGGVSPDGEWATVGGRIGSVIGTFAVAVRKRAPWRICAGACSVQWSADEKYICGWLTSRFSAEGSSTHPDVIRIPHGFDSRGCSKAVV